MILFFAAPMVLGGVQGAYAQQCPDSHLYYPNHAAADAGGCVPLAQLNQEMKARENSGGARKCGWAQSVCGQGTCPDNYFMRSVKVEQGQKCLVVTAYCCAL